MKNSPTNYLIELITNIANTKNLLNLAQLTIIFISWRKRWRQEKEEEEEAQNLNIEMPHAKLPSCSLSYNGKRLCVLVIKETDKRKL